VTAGPLPQVSGAVEMVLELEQLPGQPVQLDHLEAEPVEVELQKAEVAGEAALSELELAQEALDERPAAVAAALALALAVVVLALPVAVVALALAFAAVSAAASAASAVALSFVAADEAWMELGSELGSEPGSRQEAAALVVLREERQALHGTSLRVEQEH